MNILHKISCVDCGIIFYEDFNGHFYYSNAKDNVTNLINYPK